MRRCLAVVLILCTLVFGTTLPLFAQSPTATVNGRVRDTTGAVVQDADVQLINDHTNVKYSTKTNSEGIYSVTSLPPGTYRIQVSKAGFKTIIKPDIILNVLDARAINFDLPVGAVSETVTVEGGASLVNTESASVSTVVDRQFAENLPMNGRSFQTLIQLTPGVVLTSSNLADNGQFSVNGQRASSNYWMVDGVSANIGASSGPNPGNGMGGTVGSFSAVGGTNSLVSVDAMQEFRIQTSTYAPEFGRTPGGQISIVTRSGTNHWHGTLFDYLRNDILDANDWFANKNGLPKPRERQNDFGGTFGGPILKDRVFFFFSDEGLRLRLPRVTLTHVPCDSTCNVFGNARALAAPGMQPFLNAFPLPNGPEIFDSMGDPTGAAQFNASYSNPASLDAYSTRVDYKLTDKFSLFGRYNYSPSEFSVRGASNGVSALSVTQPSRITTHTATVGAIWNISPTIANDLRFNYSRTDGSSKSLLDNFGGAVPLTSLPFPSSFTSENGFLQLIIQSLGTEGQGIGSAITMGHTARNLQRQINVVDSVFMQRGSHSLKVGLDLRRLSPMSVPPAYSQEPTFTDVPSAETGNAPFGSINAARSTELLFRDLGMFAQDTWRVAPRLTVTYGLRWDVEFAPTSLNGLKIPAVTGYKLADFSQLAIAPAGTPPFNTAYGDVAPRLGVAYEISPNQDWGTAVRGGFGLFYDLVSSETGNLVGNAYPPFGIVTTTPSGTTFPYSPAQSAPSQIPTSGTLSQPYDFNPNLKQPYTLQWNVALQQGFGRNQSVSASYVGAAGRQLLQTTSVFFPPTNPNIGFGFFVDNTATSDYDALQLQYQRRISRGLQVLACYAWAHSLDDGSAGSFSSDSNGGIPEHGNVNRGASDFDIRHTLSVASTYDVPAPKTNGLAKAIVGGWSLQNVFFARSAPPTYIEDGNFFFFANNVVANIRPDLVPGQPLYLYGSQYPGGKALNPAAFADPPSAPIGPTCPFGFCPTRQGTTPRNFLRGLGAFQWDFAVHRDFPIHESLKLQFRAEMFNVLNHPNFGPPNGKFGSPSFGISSGMLGQSLTGYGGAGSGALNPLYQLGGPRSIQLALKMQF